MENSNYTKNILDKAEDLFNQLGYSKVTMDQLSRELGISKKTLYNHIPKKKELLKQVIERFKAEMSNEVDGILMDNELSFDEKLEKMLTLVAQRLSKITPWLIDDLRRNAPFIWEDLQNYKRDAAFRRFNLLLEEGIKEGHIQPDVNKSVAVLIYAGAIETFLNPQLINQIPENLKEQIPYTPKSLFQDMVQILLQGVLSREE